MAGADAARRAYERMLSDLSTMDAKDFVAQYCSLMMVVDRSAALAQVRSLKTMMTHITSRDPIDAYYFDQAQVGGSYRLQQGALLFNEARTNAGDAAVEAIVLFKEPSGWKLVLQQLAS